MIYENSKGQKFNTKDYNAFKEVGLKWVAVPKNSRFDLENIVVEVFEKQKDFNGFKKFFKERFYSKIDYVKFEEFATWKTSKYQGKKIRLKITFLNEATGKVFKQIKKIPKNEVVFQDGHPKAKIPVPMGCKLTNIEVL